MLIFDYIVYKGHCSGFSKIPLHLIYQNMTYHSKRKAILQYWQHTKQSILEYFESAITFNFVVESGYCQQHTGFIFI
jgi:hypothetical protein